MANANACDHPILHAIGHLAQKGCRVEEHRRDGGGMQGSFILVRSIGEANRKVQGWRPSLLGDVH